MSEIEKFIENWEALAERHWHAMLSEALERLGIRSFSNFDVCIYAHLCTFCIHAHFGFRHILDICTFCIYAHFVFIFWYLWKQILLQAIYFHSIIPSWLFDCFPCVHNIYGLLSCALKYIANFGAFFKCVSFLQFRSVFS